MFATYQIPRVNPKKKKLKKNNANKGVKIFETPPVPSLDDVSSLVFPAFQYFYQSLRPLRYSIFILQPLDH
jgi:hypothetical protein